MPGTNLSSGKPMMDFYFRELVLNAWELITDRFGWRGFFILGAAVGLAILLSFLVRWVLS